MMMINDLPFYDYDRKQDSKELETVEDFEEFLG